MFGRRNVIREGALSSLLCVVGKQPRNGVPRDVEIDDSFLDHYEESCSRSVATFMGEEEYREHVEMMMNDDGDRDASSVMSTKIDPKLIRWQTTWVLTASNSEKSARNKQVNEDNNQGSNNKLQDKTNSELLRRLLKNTSPPAPPSHMVRVNSIVDESHDLVDSQDDEEFPLPPTPPRAAGGLQEGRDEDIPRQVMVTAKSSPKSNGKKDTSVATTVSATTGLAIPRASSGVTWLKTILKTSSPTNHNKNNGVSNATTATCTSQENKPRREVTWHLPPPTRSMSVDIPSIRTNSTSQFSSELDDSLYGFDIDDEWDEALQASLLDCRSLLCDEDF